MEEKLCIGTPKNPGCQKTKPISEYSTQLASKPSGKCKQCTAFYSRKYDAGRKTRKSLKTTVETRQISEENKNFFRLGVLEGEQRAKERYADSDRAFNIVQAANKALLQVIREADERDSKRPKY